MKYIKDRFYYPVSVALLRAPDQDLFTCEERSAFSCGLWVQRYDKFLKPPNIWRSFFSPIVFCQPMNTHMSKRFIEPLNQPGKRAITWTQQAFRSAAIVAKPQSCTGHFRPPFLWGCECKGTTTFWIHQIFGEVFFRAPRSCVLHLLYIRSPSVALNIKNLLTTHEAQTLPKPRSFELRVQRYYNFSNPPNVWRVFFGGGHNEPTQYADA